MGSHTKPHTGKLYRPTDDQRRQVLTMTGFGIRQDEIATALMIDKKTLHKHFRRELDTGMTEANVRVAQALYTNATKHMNVAAQIWWTKVRMGWKSYESLDVTTNQPFAIFVPTPITNTAEWLAHHAPAQLDHDPTTTEE